MKEIADSLQYQLAVRLGIGLALLSVVSSTMIFFVNYRSQTQATTEEVGLIAGALQSQAEVAAYANNDAIADDVISGFLSFEAIAAISFSADNGFFRAAPGSWDPKSVDEPLEITLYSPVDEGTRIGEIEIAISETFLFWRVIESTSQVLFHMSILAVAVVALAILAFRKTVGKPISNLAEEISRVRLGTGHRLKIDDANRNNEVGLLATSTNELLSDVENAISVERRLRLQIEQIESRYRRIFNATKVGILILESSGQLINYNEALLKDFVGNRFSDCSPRDYQDFIPQLFERPDEAWNAIREAFRSGTPVSVDLKLRNKRKSSRWVNCIFNATSNEDGDLDFVEAVVYEVTHRRIKELKAERRAKTDSLTGLYNRYGIELHVDELMSHATEVGQSVAVLFVDLDGFKIINDEYGNDVGDDLLRVVADRIRRAAGEGSSVVGRLGGDEFVIATVIDNEAQAEKLAASLVEVIAEPIRTPECDAGLKVSASIGISKYPLDGMSSATLFRKADQAMYLAKCAGKGCYRVHEEHISEIRYRKERR